MVAGAAVVFYARSQQPYIKFMHQSEEYYADFARACAAIHSKHPVGTNHVVEIPITDSSMPEIIRALHIVKIKVGRDYVWMMHGGPGAFSIQWQGNDLIHSNEWTLTTTAESDSRIVYVGK